MVAFAVKTLIEGTVAMIAVSGELDLATAPILDDAVDVALAADVDRIVLDLADLTLLCSAGVNSILRARQLLLFRSEVPVVVTHARGIVDKVLTLTGVRELVTD